MHGENESWEAIHADFFHSFYLKLIPTSYSLLLHKIGDRKTVKMVGLNLTLQSMQNIIYYTAISHQIFFPVNGALLCKLLLITSLLSGPMDSQYACKPV